MTIKLRIKAETPAELSVYLAQLGEPHIRKMLDGLDQGDAAEPPPATEASPPPPAASAPGAEPRKQGRPKGSTNKPKTNGGEPQPETQTGAAPNGLLPLAEQIQIITDAAHDQPDKVKPLLAPLREKLGVQYISKAAEKDRPVLQDFINEHGLAV